MLLDIERARDALHAIPPDLARDDWVRAGMAAQAAGLDFDAFNDWSAGAGNYDERAARDTWHSFKPGKGVGAGTLYKLAAENGWRMCTDKPQQIAAQAPKQAVEPPRKPAPGMAAADVWSRCEPATHKHPYITQKQAGTAESDCSTRKGRSLNMAFTRSWQSSKLPSMATLWTLGESTVVI